MGKSSQLQQTVLNKKSLSTWIFWCFFSFRQYLKAWYRPLVWLLNVISFFTFILVLLWWDVLGPPPKNFVCRTRSRILMGQFFAQQDWPWLLPKIVQTQRFECFYSFYWISGRYLSPLVFRSTWISTVAFLTQHSFFKSEYFMDTYPVKTRINFGFSPYDAMLRTFEFQQFGY